MYTFDRVHKHVEKVSRIINAVYGIDPLVYVQVGPPGTIPSGYCKVSYKNSCMYIALVVPVDLELTPENKTSLTVVLCHEYCHYVDAIAHTGRERYDAGNRYEKEQIAKKADECKTWRQTRELAKELDLWDKQFFVCLKDCKYTSEITY